LTDPIDGFDAEQDNSDYIKYLIDYKLITQQELDEKGEEQIYREFNSETRHINTNNLIAAYYANLASYHLSDNNTLASYNLIKQALSIAPDSSKIEDYNLYWQIHAENIKTDTDSLSSFLLETIDSIPSSDEFRESMITESAIAIELNVSEGKFEAADSIFVKLVSVLPEEKISDTKMRRIKVFKELSKIRSKTIRGEYEEAFNLIVELYNYDSANSGVVEMYLWVGNMYMQNLGLSGNNERLIEVADTLFTDFPETQSVKDHYISACIQNVIYGGLYKTDTKKSKEILLKANNRIPGNPSIIRAIAYLYHHMAMAEIRNHRYEEALDLLYEGLQYDPENEEIKHEIDLTKGLLNKR
jgi:tetratricopeptide (TPR) repeat protein